MRSSTDTWVHPTTIQHRNSIPGIPLRPPHPPIYEPCTWAPRALVKIILIRKLVWHPFPSPRPIDVDGRFQLENGRCSFPTMVIHHSIQTTLRRSRAIEPASASRADFAVLAVRPASMAHEGYFTNSGIQVLPDQGLYVTRAPL